MPKLRLGAVLTLFSQEHASPVYGVRRETGDATHRLDQLMVVISHLEFFFQLPLCSCASSVVRGWWPSPSGDGSLHRRRVVDRTVWHYSVSFREGVGYTLPAGSAMHTRH